jgi:NAD(P)-dependent dehydrogenase (short-subunit alcohol dehydrogenase family)
MTKTWFITGAARGLGLAVARAALKAGDRLIATSRSADSLSHAISGDPDHILFLPLDVTDRDAPRRAVEAAVQRFGRIDVLVNNAGYGHIGLFEETSETDIERQFDTNVFGLMRMTRAVLPTMRAQRSGHIINLSSVGGRVAFDLCTIYGASKFAVEGFSVNLAKDLEPCGIRVTVVSPGFFRTDFLDPSSVRLADNHIADYDSTRRKFEDAYRGMNHHQLGDPAKFGAAMVKMAAAENPPLHFLVGSDAVGFVHDEIAARSSEMEAWAPLSATSDRDDISVEP